MGGIGDTNTQNLLRLSNYLASGIPYYTGVYIPVINTITYNANIILNRSANTFYTVRSTGNNSTIDSLVIGDATVGTFSEVTLNPTISVVGTIASVQYSFVQIRWWNATNIAIFTVDQGSPFALKLYTVNISTGVVTSIGTLISTALESNAGLMVGVNSDNVFVQTTNLTSGTYSNNLIKVYNRSGVLTDDYVMPLLYYYTSGTRKNFYIPYSMVITDNYLLLINFFSIYDIFISSLSSIQKIFRITNNISNIFGSSFNYQNDFDMTSIYLQGNNTSGSIYITESDLIKYATL
jgi:hypothetical protein